MYNRITLLPGMRTSLAIVRRSMHGLYTIPSRYLAVFTICACCLLILIRVFSIFSGGWDRIVIYLPDDAFYYFVTANNFAHAGVWSFDGGISHTTGFHLLHAYVLAAVDWLLGSEGIFKLPLVSVAITLSFGIAGALIIWASVRRTFGELAAISLTIPILSYGYLVNTTSGMEWGWVLIASSLIFAIFLRTDVTKPLWYELSAIYVLGIILELGRSDAGAIAASFVAATLVISLLRPNSGALRLSLALLLGALTALLFTFFHNYYLSGHIVSGSAKIKLLWGQRTGGLSQHFGGFSPQPFLHLMRRHIGIPMSLSDVVAMLPFVAVVGSIIVASVRSHRATLLNIPLGTLNVVAASIFILVSYFVLTGFNPASTQPWYGSLIIVPICFLLAAAAKLLTEFAGRVTRIAAAALWAVTTVYDVYYSFDPPWPNQVYMRQAGILTVRQHDGERVGCWNCGIIGFFGNRNVINLDGLMNNDVYDFVKANRLQEYIKSKNIHYLLDFSETVEQKMFQRRGGYDNDSFRRMVRPVDVLSPRLEPMDENNRMALYRVDYSFGTTSTNRHD